MVVSKILHVCAKCTLTTPVTSPFSELHLTLSTNPVTSDLKRMNETRVCAHGPVECLAEVMQSEICPHLCEQFRPLRLFQSRL